MQFGVDADRAPRAALPRNPALGDAGLVNLSARANAGSGANALIIGFSLSGTGSKPLLLRGLGPTLGAFEVSGALPDPTLRLDVLNGPMLAQNDGWGGTTALSAAAAGVGAFALPAASRDAALLQTLRSAAYTAQIGGGSGVALLEVYDTDEKDEPRLTNVSARTNVGAGADILIAGFTFTGTGKRPFLIRAVGPSLGAFGVAGVLANPKLEVYRQNGAMLAENDDWGRATNVAEIRAAATSVGAFALTTGSLDAVMLVELDPGGYTAQVSGVGGSTGVALVEVYAVP
jgi:hypothetical protein